MRAYCLSAIIFLLLLTHDVCGQLQPKYYIYNTERGLRSNTVYDVHRGRNGLLYIAHEKGLSSFDGRNFINYSLSKFPNSEITNILETESGKIICEKFNNDVYCLNEEHLEQIGYFPSNIGFSAASCDGNKVYNLRNDTLAILDLASGKMTATPLQAADKRPRGRVVFIGKYKSNAGVVTVYVTGDSAIGYMWPLQQYAEYKWYLSNGRAYGVPPNKDRAEIIEVGSGETISVEGLGGTGINCITGTEKNLWICAVDGLYRRRAGKSGSFTKMMGGYNVTCVEELNNSSVIAGTAGNGLLYVPNFDVQVYSGVPQNISFMGAEAGTLVLGGEDGSLFTLGVADGKVSSRRQQGRAPISFYYGREKTQFIESSGQLNDCMQQMAVRDYCEVGGNTLFATSAGMYMYRWGTHKHWVEKFATEVLPCGLKKLSFSSAYTGSITYDKKHDKLFYNNFDGIYELDSAMKQPKPVLEPNCALKDMKVYEGQLYLASKDKGVLRLEKDGYHAISGLNDIFYMMHVWGRELWILGETGLYCYQDGAVRKYGNNIGLSPGEIRSFLVDSASVYVMEAGSVVRFSKRILYRQATPPGFILHGVVGGGKIVKEGEQLEPDRTNLQFKYSFVLLGNTGNAYAAYSMNGGEKIKLPPTSNVLEFTYLPAGKYVIDFYIADGGRYTKVQAFKFSVVPHFYNTIWFYMLLTIVVCGALYWYNKRRIATIKSAFELRQAKLLLERELDKSVLTSIKAQMNPHFLFNALNTIQSYVYMNDKVNAGIYISKFSELTRCILDHSSKEAVSLSEELEALRLYLELEKMRFDGDMEYDISIDERINAGAMLMPPLLMPPYVENAIKHGLFHKRANRHLAIRFIKRENRIRIEIEDNGIGRKRSEELNNRRYKEHKSFSMSANRKRLDILKQYQPDIFFDVVDILSATQEPMGTRVIIELPEKWTWGTSLR